MGRICSMYGAIHKCIQSLSGKPEGKKPLGRPRRRWEDNIIMDLREVGLILETGEILLKIGTSGELM